MGSNGEKMVTRKTEEESLKISPPEVRLKRGEVKRNERGGENQMKKRWYYVEYHKNIHTETEILKMKSVIWVKLPKDGTKAIIIELNCYEELKNRYDMGTVQFEVEFEKVEPVIDRSDVIALCQWIASNKTVFIGKTMHQESDVDRGIIHGLVTCNGS
ncbi:uncharacterized protein LOC118765683 [Octopus sinensis]|uniref:Uncharacterized protein LOC118765683 n=1 Tax=Octopus sinensis TaxID=2607531 RepID=A0A7E6F871_9MOLL|nr:uncharacterized protein LOC118765683 [Octopus sinensis]